MSNLDIYVLFCPIHYGYMTRKSKLTLSWKLPPCWLTFIELEGVTQTVREKNSSTVSHSYRSNMLQYQSTKQNMHSEAIMVLQFW